MTARDLAMNVALPEVDGRILSRAVSFKAAGVYDEADEANIVGHEPMADRVAFLLRNWPPTGRGCGRRSLLSAAWRSSWPIIPTATAGLATASVSIRLPGTIEVLKAMRCSGYPD